MTNWKAFFDINVNFIPNNIDLGVILTFWQFTKIKFSQD